MREKLIPVVTLRRRIGNERDGICGTNLRRRLNKLVETEQNDMHTNLAYRLKTSLNEARKRLSRSHCYKA